MSASLSLSLVLKTASTGSLSFPQLNTYTESPLTARLRSTVSDSVFLADLLLLLWALSVDRALPNLAFGLDSLL